MKKAFLLGVTLLATFSLTGCEMIENLLQGGQDLLNEKKDYKYDDFAVLVADKNFTFSYTKCTAEKDLAGEKTTIEYTYNSEDKLWHYQTESGNDKSEDLSIVEVLLCDTMLRDQTDRFLDDTTVDQVRKALNRPVRIVRNNGESLIRALWEMEDTNG